jgi:hypothetical protein
VPRAIATWRARENIDSISLIAALSSIRSMKPDARGIVIAKSADAIAITTVSSMIVNAFLLLIQVSSVHGILRREGGHPVIGILPEAAIKFALSEVRPLRYIYRSSPEEKP